MKLLTTDNLKQLGLITLILILGISIFNRFTTFIPGALAAITLYVLLRKYYLILTEKRKWKKWLTATLFIVGSIIVFVIPAYFLFQAIIPKISGILSQSDKLQSLIDSLITSIKELGVPIDSDGKAISDVVTNITSSIPVVLGATANVLTNVVLAFFFLYFMLVQNKQMERAIQGFMPLKGSNVDDIWDATRLVVNANAIGIPILAICQGLVAVLGYLIFGVESYILLGALTGLFSIVPVVGCAIVWAPVCIQLAATGNTGAALGLALYSFIITGGIDNVLRFTILKRLGDVHPVVTTVGIIIGVPMFGFMGFIFGPLLVSYLLLLIKIYRVEFAADPDAVKLKSTYRK